MCLLEYAPGTHTVTDTSIWDLGKSANLNSPYGLGLGLGLGTSRTLLGEGNIANRENVENGWTSTHR